MMISHSELIQKAGKWLKHHKDGNCIIPNCSFILAELVALTHTGETPDILGFSTNQSVMIEVKVSRSDFLNDKKKMFRGFDDYGMGQHKYYCCPESMIKPEEIPDNWGLLYWTGKRIKIEKYGKWQEANLISERTMLLSVIRRLKEQINEL